LFCVVIAIWQQFAVGDTIDAQFISHYYSGLGPTSFYHSLKKTLSIFSITPLVQVDVYDLTVLVNSTP
jgi:hypothetical protein